MTRKRLPYPPVGKIAVTKKGHRIAVWPPNANPNGCFSGQLLEDGNTDICVCWKIAAIDHCEMPTATDRALSLINIDELHADAVAQSLRLIRLSAWPPPSFDHCEMPTAADQALSLINISKCRSNACECRP